MTEASLYTILNNLSKSLKGEFYIDETHKILYATDASAYREKPLAVAIPKDKEDLKQLIQFANANQLSLIPRAAGTSLAGQVVGNGIVVDISKHFNQILELNIQEKWVRVQSGVIRDELNMFLKKHQLFFAPETSTSNRCMMGGMLGNNACGAHSLVYGSTRDHTKAVKVILSDGSEALFSDLSSIEFDKKLIGNTLENKIYQNIEKILSDPENGKEIIEQFPDPELERRNTGYALDLLLRSEKFGEGKSPFNFSKLLAGSEGTLAFTTEITLNLEPLPHADKALICVHLNTVEEALKANLIALKYKPVSIELMDKAIMDLTKSNKAQAQNRFFVQGDPGAILIVEFAEEDMAVISQKAADMEADMRSASYGLHFPKVVGDDMKKVWDLRKAGLGVLSNMPGDANPVPVIEDTAVLPHLLPDYIAEINKMLAKYKKSCVYYAHIATGELHLRPILNLKNAKDVELFHQIAHDTAVIVKKYRGSISGEHGDGRLRGEFIPIVLGEKNLKLFKDLKQAWDPNHIFNPGKITDTPKMNTMLRSEGLEEKDIDTIFRFDNGPGILRSAERCNGSGDCRKSAEMGGTMCPSFQATRDEKNSTRARANILREFLSRSEKTNPFDHEEIYEVLDLCLSCKACKTECPSNVDVAKLKAEFLQHYYDEHGVPLRSNLIAHISSLNKLSALFPRIYNAVFQNNIISKLMMKTLGFSTKRKMPVLYKTTLDKWFNNQSFASKSYAKTVYLFNDEFTRYNDAEIGIKAIQLLNKLNYKVVIPKHKESGRTFLSKGLLRKAKRLAENNVALLAAVVTNESPLIGIEPSTILSFRDEYPELVKEEMITSAKELATNTFTIEEFLAAEFEKGNIKSAHFTDEPKVIKFHGHCQQKALSGTSATQKVLSIPKNYQVEEIPSGCCGMAGSFGFEKEHYGLSMKVGELVLFPAVRQAADEVVIAASGTSCRHQIKDGTGKRALHPVEILFEAIL